LFYPEEFEVFPCDLCGEHKSLCGHKALWRLMEYQVCVLSHGFSAIAQMMIFRRISVFFIPSSNISAPPPGIESRPYPFNSFQSIFQLSILPGKSYNQVRLLKKALIWRAGLCSLIFFKSDPNNEVVRRMYASDDMDFSNSLIIKTFYNIKHLFMAVFQLFRITLRFMEEQNLQL